MKIDNVIQKFLHAKAADNLSLTTLDYYNTVLKVFRTWLDKQQITDIGSISQDTIEDYMIYMRYKYAPATLKGRYIALAILFNWITEQGYLLCNPMEKMSMPKIPKKKLPSFSQTEINKILNLYDLDNFIGLRNYTIMLTLFATGIRRSELLGMNMMSIEGGIIRVIGKGQKEREIPISKRLLRAYRTYLAARKSFLGNDVCDAFWLNKDKRPLKYSGLSEVFSHIKEALPECSTRVSPHTFRHTFALLYVKNGGDAFSLKELLGHEDIATTQIYVDMQNDDVQHQFNQYNPLDNHKWKY